LEADEYQRDLLRRLNDMEFVARNAMILARALLATLNTYAPQDRPAVDAALAMLAEMFKKAT
jgi:hypothetical protein